MGQEELKEEIDAIEAIFPDTVEFLTSEIYNFTVPNHEQVRIQISFPVEYPEQAPSIIQVITRDVRKFPDNNYLEELITQLLLDLFNVGDVVIFEFLGEVEQFFEEYEQRHQEETKKIEQQMENLRIEEMKQKRIRVLESTHASTQVQQPPKLTIDVTASWFQSEPVIDRGSTFIAFAKQVHSVDEARDHFELLLTDRKISRANHNMNAWRIKGENGVAFQDCDDDGETAAGLRMLHLLQVCISFHAVNFDFITNYLDYGCVERCCRGQQMVRRNTYWAGSFQTHQLNHPRGINQRRVP